MEGTNVDAMAEADQLPVEANEFSTMIPSPTESTNPTPVPSASCRPTALVFEEDASAPPSKYIRLRDSPTRLADNGDGRSKEPSDTPSFVPSNRPTLEKSQLPTITPSGRPRQVVLRVYPTRKPTFSPTGVLPRTTWKSNRSECPQRSDGSGRCGGRNVSIAVVVLALSMVIALVVFCFSLWRRRLYMLKCCRNAVSEPDSLVRVIDHRVTTLEADEQTQDEEDDDLTDAAVDDVNMGHLLPPPRLGCRRSVLKRKTTYSAGAELVTTKNKSAKLGRRVRFSIPGETPEGGLTPNGIDEAKSENDDSPVSAFSTRAGDLDAWMTWVLNPVFETAEICTTPNRICSSTLSPDEDSKSLNSYASTATPSIASHEEEKSGFASFPSTDWYFCLESASEHAVVDTDAPISQLSPETSPRLPQLPELLSPSKSALQPSPSPPMNAPMEDESVSPPPSPPLRRNNGEAGRLGILDRKEFMPSRSIGSAKSVRRKYISTLLESTPEKKYNEYQQELAEQNPLTRGHPFGVHSAKTPHGIGQVLAGSAVDSPFYDSDEELDTILRDMETLPSPKRLHTQFSFPLDSTYHTTEDFKEDMNINCAEI